MRSGARGARRMMRPEDAMTPLEPILKARIAADGPMTVADYMASCLSHPRHGYYATRDPFGRAGDFVTAQEVSQMFGEMIGLWLSVVWRQIGAPSPVRLVELGPGRGTLMADALRAARGTGLAEAAEVWLVETSPALRAAQADRVPDARWADALSEVPGGPMLLVANEFLDALPVRQFIAGRDGWHERLVGLEGDRLAFGLSPPLPGPAAEGAWAERSAALSAVVAEIAGRLRSDAGAALLLDYGYIAESRPPGPTLQAVRRHRKVDPLFAPGECDLTWLMDFDALASGFAGLSRWQAPQGAFLAALGIGERAARLAAAAPDEADAIADALERLTAPGEMGTLFRALAVLPEGAACPPGFADA